MIDFKIISDLGLSDKETALYMACLKTGPSGASELAKTTGIQRTHIYDLAEKLADKGFLTQTRKEDKKIFAARSPEEILAVKRIELKKFADSIPELEKLARQKNNRKKTSRKDLKPIPAAGSWPPCRTRPLSRKKRTKKS